MNRLRSGSRKPDGVPRRSLPPYSGGGDTPHAAFMQRFVGLALEVFRREKITLAKLRELTRLIDVSAAQLEALLHAAGLGDAASLQQG